MLPRMWLLVTENSTGDMGTHKRKKLASLELRRPRYTGSCIRQLVFSVRTQVCQSMQVIGQGSGDI